MIRFNVNREFNKLMIIINQLRELLKTKKREEKEKNQCFPFYIFPLTFIYIYIRKLKVFFLKLLKNIKGRHCIMMIQSYEYCLISSVTEMSEMQTLKELKYTFLR